MLAFKGMLLSAAERAGIKTPLDAENFNPDEFPHFQVFCTMQLGRPMPYPEVHFDNAQVIAKIPEENIRTIPCGEVIDMGFQIGFPMP